jgi:DNA-binding NtrC family response regulator
MNILIAEDELYLAQSISNALSEHLNETNVTLVTTTNDAVNQNKNFDIVILSSTLSGNIYNIIDKYNNSTIILLIPYRNHDTVIAPLNAGVDTYITKPLMIEELIRKINHHLEFKKLKKENMTYKSYFNMIFKNSKNHLDTDKIEFPLFIKSTNKKQIDKYVFDLSIHLNLPISFYDLSEKVDLNEIRKDNNLIYLLNFNTLKTSVISKLFDIISNKKVIVELKSGSSFEHPNLITLKSEKNEMSDDYIMSIEEYIKFIIKKYETKLPDTELSKKLGISRKSLWEKRKKHGLNKKKVSR